jgi:hypothetical protein
MSRRALKIQAAKAEHWIDQIMPIARIPNSLLQEVGQWSLIRSEINKTIAEQNNHANYQQQQRIDQLHEARRILRNYHYQKDTEWIRNYEFYESIKEQRLLARHTVRGIFVDRYV